MKLGKSKLALAKVINENGGWIDGAKFSSQDKDGNAVCFYSNSKPTNPLRGELKWRSPTGTGYMTDCDIVAESLISNWHQTILSREEYYQAYPKADADGWIEWKGGECPVDGESIVDVELNSGNIVSGVAKGLSWRHEWKYSNVIAYRLHKPKVKPEVKPEFCESVMRSIPEPESHEKLSPEAIEDAKFALMSESIEESKRKPTIEQLAQDYRNAKDYADRKQQEADEAKADVEVKLKELELACEAIGLLVSPIIAKQEHELAAAVKVGDEVECVESNIKRDKYNGMVGRLHTIDESDTSTPYLVDFGGNEKIWCHKVKFISRP